MHRDGVDESRVGEQVVELLPQVLAHIALGGIHFGVRQALRTACPYQRLVECPSTEASLGMMSSWSGPFIQRHMCSAAGLG